jgi:shikimate kinase
MESKGHPLALVGPRGAGKTLVSRLLSRELDLPLLDTDRIIAEEEKMSLADIFSAKGEPFFRRAESRALAAALEQGRTVVATGGGAVLLKRNRSLLRNAAFTIYLTAPVVVLYRRISLDPGSEETRPPLTGLDPLAEMAAVVEARDSLYRECARLVVETNGLSPDEVCRAILSAAPLP